MTLEIIVQTYAEIIELFSCKNILNQLQSCQSKASQTIKISICAANFKLLTAMLIHCSDCALLMQMIVKEKLICIMICVELFI